MWTNILRSKVQTRISVECKKKFASDYPDITITTSSRASTTPKFPTIYIQELFSPERGMDTEGTSVNAVLKGFQIEVTDNKSENRAQEVADYIFGIMKSMDFHAVGVPYAENTNDVYKVVARYQRMIADGDPF